MAVIEPPVDALQAKSQQDPVDRLREQYEAWFAREQRYPTAHAKAFGWDALQAFAIQPPVSLAQAELIAAAKDLRQHALAQGVGLWHVGEEGADGDPLRGVIERFMAAVDAIAATPAPTTPAFVESERASFERVAVAQGHQDLSRSLSGEYQNIYLECAWSGWQQRAVHAEPQEKAAERYLKVRGLNVSVNRQLNSLSSCLGYQSPDTNDKYDAFADALTQDGDEWTGEPLGQDLQPELAQPHAGCCPCSGCVAVRGDLLEDLIRHLEWDGAPEMTPMQYASSSSSYAHELRLALDQASEPLPAAAVGVDLTPQQAEVRQMLKELAQYAPPEGVLVAPTATMGFGLRAKRLLGAVGAWGDKQQPQCTTCNDAGFVRNPDVCGEHDMLHVACPECGTRREPVTPAKQVDTIPCHDLAEGLRRIAQGGLEFNADAEAVREAAEIVERAAVPAVPASWRRAVYNAAEVLTGCLASAEIASQLHVGQVEKVVQQLRETHTAILDAQAASGDQLAGDIACDRHYVAGLRAGWNFAQSEDEAGIQQAIAGRLRDVREAGAATPPAAPGS